MISTMKALALEKMRLAGSVRLLRNIVTSETEELALNVNRQEVTSGSGYFILFPSSAAKIVVLMSL